MQKFNLNTMLSKNNKAIIYLIIFFAGFSFLIYEVSWNRYLSFVLGTTVTASTIVLSAFMAGFGLGALILSKYIDKCYNLGRFMAKLLAGISIMSFANYFIFEFFINNLFGTFANLLIADIIFFSLTFILLLIPAFFMGGIIPLVSKIIISNNKGTSNNIGKVYAFETLGSTIGGLFAGFVLLGSIGQKETIFVAVAINIILASYLLISKKYNNLIKIEDKIVKQKDLQANFINSHKIAKISTLVFGFAILSMQIIWIRIFKVYFTNTSYTFTIITSIIILGLFFGSSLYKKYAPKIRSNDFMMIKLIVLTSILLLLGLILLLNLPEILFLPLGAVAKNQYIRLIVVPVIASLFIVLPPALISGFAFPLACNMNTKKRSKLSSSIGKILTFNTIGSVIGPIIVTFILIPILGVGKSLIIVSVILSLSVIYFFNLLKGIIKTSKLKKVILTKLVILLLLLFVANKMYFMPPSIKILNKKVIAYNETVEGTITLVDEPKKGVFGKSTFVNNSSVIGSNYDALKAVKMIGHIPFFSALKCKKTLVIGFGIGVTSSAIAQHKEVQTIDCIELVPQLTQLANNYKEFNFGIYNSSKLNVIKGDGRHFLQTTSNKYDLISCDPTHPVLGSGNLYTQEYFKQVYEHLNDEGMISQYLPLHKLRLEDLLGIIKTFHSVFENSTVWLGQYHAILIGKKGNGKIDFGFWQNSIRQMPKDDFFYFEPYHIAANVIFDANKIEELTKNAKINTDNLSYTEFFSFDCFNENNLYNNLKFLSENRCDINNVFANIYNAQLMNKFIAGNKKLTESLYYSLIGDKNNALNKLREAVIVNPEDKEFPFFIKFYYGLNK